MKKFILILIIGNILLSNICAKEQNTSCNAMFDWNIEYSPISAYPLVFINFKDYSEGNVISWEWYVNDSLISKQKNPVYSVILNFNAKCKSTKCLPVYNVCLKIKTSEGCESTTCKEVSLYDTKTCEVKYNYYVIPEDSIITPDMYLKGTYRPVRFFGISNNDVVKWHWDFGDSTSSEEQNPVHTYILNPNYDAVNCLQKGTNCIPSYYVCLTIKTSDGCESYYCDYISPLGNTTPTCNSSFKYDVLESNPPQYKFTNTSTWEGGTVLWSFGDGTYSTDENPTHVFDSNASDVSDTMSGDQFYKMPRTDILYTVCLTIHSNNGCISSSCQNIYVQPLNNLCGNHIKLTTSLVVGSTECTGYAKAELTDNNGNIVTANNYLWSNGSTENEIFNVCPNEPFKVFITNEKGCVTRGEFVLSGTADPVYIQYNFENSNFNLQYLNPTPDYTYTWQFCDGTVKTGAYVTYKSDEDCKANLSITDYYGTVISNEYVFLSTAMSKLNCCLPSDFKFFPNPVNDELHIQLNMQVQPVISVKIVDMNGRVWSSQKIENASNFTINVENLPKGAYICRIQTGGNTVFRKFIK